jgi:hypothetical protein
MPIGSTTTISMWIWRVAGVMGGAATASKRGLADQFVTGL